MGTVVNIHTRLHVVQGNEFAAFELKNSSTNSSYQFYDAKWHLSPPMTGRGDTSFISFLRFYINCEDEFFKTKLWNFICCIHKQKSDLKITNRDGKKE